MKCITVFVLVGLNLGVCIAGGMPDLNQHSIDPQVVMGKTWQWVSTVTPVEEITVAAPERYTLILQPDGGAQVLFDCNQGKGDYTIAPGRLSFGPLISTRMACLPDSQDVFFMRDLQRVKTFFMEGEKLFLELPMDSGTMHFRQQP